MQLNTKPSVSLLRIPIKIYLPDPDNPAEAVEFNMCKVNEMDPADYFLYEKTNSSGK